MKKIWQDPTALGMLAWFYVIQPALFLFGIAVFLHGVYQSIWG
jgi:hypothetical protein